LNDILRDDSELGRGRIFLHGRHAHGAGIVDAQCHAKCASTGEWVGLPIGLGAPGGRRHEAEDRYDEDSEV
jgi:hypothetical protein